MSKVIEVVDLVKEYRIYRRPLDRLKEIIPFSKPSFRSFLALKGITFSVTKGETIGIVGQNGAGKSTLLQIIAGVLNQTSGVCRVEGQVGSLLELGAGFHPDFNGIENIFLQARLMGIDRGVIKERLPSILEFADIGDFVHQPVRTYSSGMFVRLAFSTAIHMDPEILVVDEALSVGDVFFQHKCISRMRKLQEEGKTILVVSHDPQTIRHMCGRALHLRQGELVGDGDPAGVVAAYLQEKVAHGRGPARTGGAPSEEVPCDEGLSPAPELLTGLERYGEGGARITGFLVADDRGKPLKAAETGEAVRVRVTAKADRLVAGMNLGVLLRDKKGLDITGTNLSLEGHPLPRVEEGASVTAEFRLQLPLLAPGNYAFSPAVAEGDHVDYKMLDWVENAGLLQIRSSRTIIGHVRVPVSVKVNLHREESKT